MESKSVQSWQDDIDVPLDGYFTGELKSEEAQIAAKKVECGVQWRCDSRNIFEDNFYFQEGRVIMKAVVF